MSIVLLPAAAQQRQERDDIPPVNCPACRRTDARVVEQISTERLAGVWDTHMQAAGTMLREQAADGGVPTRISTLRCRSCGLEWFDPSFAAGPEWYELIENYCDRWEYGETLADLAPGSRVLELGCGEGFFLARARAAGHSATGLDFNARAVAVARAEGFDALAADLRSFGSRPGAPPQAVALFHVIEHIEDLDAFFRDLRAVMPPGSRLHFSCPSPNRLTPSLARAGRRDVWDYPPHHQTRWCREAAEALLERLGWRMVRYAEEPFDWRGTATFLAGLHADRSAVDFAGLPRWRRQAAIARRMAATASAPLRCSGPSMYCFARRLADGN